jgi:hypothetical protein
MRIDTWGGLITNASPFALPPGAAVEQSNLTTDVAGQLTSRGGMRPVQCVQRIPTILDCYPHEVDGKVYLVALAANGELLALESPSYGRPVPRPAEPSLAVASGQTATSYSFRYRDADVDGVGADGPEAEPAQPARISVIDGGAAGATMWPYYVDANQLCQGGGKVGQFDGGGAATASVPASILPAELCSP